MIAGATPERVRPRLRSVARLVRRSATFRWAGGGAVPARILALLEAAIDGTEPPAAERRLVGARLTEVPLLVVATEPVDG